MGTWTRKSYPPYRPLLRLSGRFRTRCRFNYNWNESEKSSLSIKKSPLLVSYYFKSLLVLYNKYILFVFGSFFSFFLSFLMLLFSILLLLLSFWCRIEQTTQSVETNICSDWPWIEMKFCFVDFINIYFEKT